MKYLSTLLSHFRPVQMFVSILLSAVLVFASGCTADTKNTPTARTVQIDNTKGVAKSAATKGTVQLDKIEQKSQEALDAPATSLKTIEERSQGALNEVQGSADRNKMNSSNDPKLPVVKQAEKTLNKMKNS